MGNVPDPVLVSESAPASWDCEFLQYVNEDAGTLQLLKHHQVELIKPGVKFGRAAFIIHDLHEYKSPNPIVMMGKSTMVVLMKVLPHMA